MHWIIDNRTWLFSGVGVVAISLVFNLVWKHFKKSPQSVANLDFASIVAPVNSPIATGSIVTQNIHYGTAQAQTTDFSDYYESPTPTEIREKLDKLPPYQKESMMEHFIGLKVRWLTRFADIFKTYEEGQYHLLLQYGNNLRDVVACDVSLDDFPRLKVSTEGDYIEVTGTIERVHTLGVNLKDAWISFPGPH